MHTWGGSAECVHAHVAGSPGRMDACSTETVVPALPRQPSTVHCPHQRNSKASTREGGMYYSWGLTLGFKFDQRCVARLATACL
jgi:hypothetical protein